MSQNILELKNINKSFGAAKVLKDVSFELQPAEVHALVGGNGAGKSTLMKIMTGVYTKDSGEIIINGEHKEIHNTNDAKANGIAMIFQEMSLVPTLSIMENIFLGNELKKGAFRDVAAMKKRTREVLEELGLDLNPDTRVSELSVGLTQMVEIAKAVSKDVQILIFDEPSAALSDQETARLFEIIRQLKDKGVSMVYISHRMNEILEICDRVSILRDGQNVITEETANLTMEKIVAYMLGDANSGHQFEWIPRDYDKKGSDVLEVKNLKINEKLDDISFSLKKGEILGFAGLMGSGRTEIMETLFGIRRPEKGEILVGGQKVHSKSPAEAVKNGFGLVPENRRREGLVLIHSVRENAILPVSTRYTKNKIFNDDRRINQVVTDNIQDLGVKTSDMNQEIGLLSGGNQQKIVIAKWLNSDPRILMFDEPTAGVDIGAKGEIIKIIRKYADEGGSVLFASSEIAEMLAICDRIITLFDGKITGEFRREDISTEEELQNAIQRK
ncbi:MAG: sugar ABC transporter ATP-binding protein [Parasporobacterium sp.]|nr:sugar ABC transporter ATP-binding protein [Parasporobacterium sp.]